jgi:hypothetical protein
MQGSLGQHRIPGTSVTAEQTSGRHYHPGSLTPRSRIITISTSSRKWRQQRKLIIFVMNEALHVVVISRTYCLGRIQLIDMAMMEEQC